MNPRLATMLAVSVLAACVSCSSPKPVVIDVADTSTAATTTATSETGQHRTPPDTAKTRTQRSTTTTETAATVSDNAPICDQVEEFRAALEEMSGETATTNDAIESTIELYRDEAETNGATEADLNEAIAQLRSC